MSNIVCRYGPSRHQGNLKDKLFKSSKTELYYYGGKTFTADSKKISQSSKKEPGKSDMYVCMNVVLVPY